MTVAAVWCATSVRSIQSSLEMANTTQVAATAAPFPSSEEIARVEEWTREPFAHDQEALRPGTAARRALDAALAEIEAGRDTPSIEWRRQFSLLLGLERLLAEEEPKLADGAVLSAHQVDALSGTLTALIAEAERQNGAEATVDGDEAGWPDADGVEDEEEDEE